MEKRKIPGTDIEVTVICQGAMNWGQQNDEVEAHAQLDRSIELGVNFIDTAEVYPIPPEREKQGTTERYVGSWLKKRGRRDDLVIASKVSGTSQSRTIATRDATAGYTRANIRQAIEGSLTRLGTDYLDLYQVHVPERRANFFGVRGVQALPEHDPGAAIEETLSALSELVKEGKVRAIGVSNETPWGLMQYLTLARERGLARVATIQNQYSLINRSFEIGLSEMCLREGVGLLAYSPLSMGVLTGKYLGGKQPAGARFTIFERNRERYNNSRVQAVVERYVELAKEHGLDPAAMALAYCASRAFVTSVIIGTTSVTQVETDVGAGELTLPPEVVAGIEAIHDEHPNPQA